MTERTDYDDVGPVKAQALEVEIGTPEDFVDDSTALYD